MCRVTRLSVRLLALLVLLGIAAPALAVFPPPVDDKGKFFTKDALDKANKKIRAIYQKYKKDVVVVTLPALSSEQTKKLEEEGKGKYFAKMARDAAVDVGLNGIYVVIARKPTHLHTHVDPDTLKKGFNTGNRKTFNEKLIAAFKEDNFDAGLMEALDYVESTLKANIK